MQLYHYSPITGEFLGETQARPSPLEPGEFLIPAHATATAPPAAGANQVAVFSGEAWSMQADFRGTSYWTDAATLVEIAEIGTTVPEGATTTAPPSARHVLSEGAWVAPPATPEEVKAEAHRRIVAIVPEWKQRNLIAQASRLAEKGRANWTAGELAAWDAGEAIWMQVSAIRTASDVIEAMDPIPADITAAELWP
ncbi:hypothetical protein P6F26_16880 [Roseibacterium sp. SDUM158017]|uniref:hypothetical protein n=1 Tax=Roseicyclus salinarum TaxID=3036773 RepID=UPI0024153E25|nr:hypothetical protein [Roseibacterium sp. SDUM158017]MDG4650125.1 hypothetical protein [Roseibacterium sp. SDUM158017]